MTNGSSTGPAAPEPNPDQAWKALGLVNDWIRHAEAKTAATLAAAGVTGGVLYNLCQHETPHPPVGLVIVALICGVAIVASAGSAIIALAPQLRPPTTTVRPPLNNGSTPPPDDLANLLFYAHIARDYKGDAPTYTQVLSTLTSDQVKLTEQIGHQVHANAHVAQRKYWWANCAIIALGVDLSFLAITAILVVWI